MNGLFLKLKMLDIFVWKSKGLIKQTKEEIVKMNGLDKNFEAVRKSCNKRCCKDAKRLTSWNKMWALSDFFSTSSIF